MTKFDSVVKAESVHLDEVKIERNNLHYRLPAFVAWPIGNAASKKHRSGGEPLATVCLI